MDKKDPPIVPQSFLGGVRVVDIGDFRVSRGLSRRASSSCNHHSLVFDISERRIWCKDCETDVEAFDAFHGIALHFSRQTSILADRERLVADAEAHSLISRAAKVIDDAWRKKKLAPCCPHCKEALLPEDFKNGVGCFVGRSFALAKRSQK